MNSSLKPQQKQLGYRKSSKPLMERRRRARINACLAQLRTLLMQAHITQSCRQTRLEKADILEMTVRHMKSMAPTNSDAMPWSLFRAGYNDCVPDKRPPALVFLQPLHEKISVNTKIVDCLSFDQHWLTKGPATGRYKMGNLETAGVEALQFISNRPTVSFWDSLSQVHSVYTTSRPSLKVDAPEMSRPDGIEVWRPW